MTDDDATPSNTVRRYARTTWEAFAEERAQWLERPEPERESLWPLYLGAACTAASLLFVFVLL